VVHADEDLLLQVVSGYTYIGCYVDASDRDLEVNGGALDAPIDQRAMQCAMRCDGYLYMGMQWTNECFCDNDYGGLGERTIDNCDSDSSVGAFPDYADRAATDGGGGGLVGWTNAVYSITYTTPVPGSPSVSGVTATGLSTPSGCYDTATLSVGAQIYSDRDFVIQAGLPDFLDGVTYVVTAEADRSVDGTTANVLCFDVDQAATMYLLWDDRAQRQAIPNGVPQWVADLGFADAHTSIVAANNPELVDGLELFVMDVAAGQVCLGGNGGSGDFPISHYLCRRRTN